MVFSAAITYSIMFCHKKNHEEKLNLSGNFSLPMTLKLLFEIMKTQRAINSKWQYG